MNKMWAGRTAGELNQIADQFNASIPFDQRLYRQDIQGSIMHAEMLAAQGIISATAKDHIIAGLEEILRELEDGTMEVDLSAEDVHMFIEAALTEKIGDEGKMLHTARSRNDQVALDLRIYVKEEIEELQQLLIEMIESLVGKAEEYKKTVMPGYTHLQRAQPITFGHHLMAYAMMYLRDLDRLKDVYKRTNVSPIGCCALAGTTYPTDRRMEAAGLGFADVCRNSLDGVSDRDYCVELLSALSILMMHFSRLAEEVVLWSSWEFKFVELSDDFTTGSSIMPQKKNPDMAELARGKTGRVYGDLISLLTVLKGIPLAYNKDMQEDKEPVFDAIDTTKICLQVFAPMISAMKANEENMMHAAQKGFINATDLADYMTKKGMPFREAYKITGTIVSDCIRKGTVLEKMSIEEYKEYSDIFEEDLYDAIDLINCVKRRNSEGGTSVESVEAQVAYVKKEIEKELGE